MEEDWEGTERRTMADRRTVDDKIHECKLQIETELTLTNRNVTELHGRFNELHGEVVGLRFDVHKMTETVAGIDSSLRGINESISKLSNFPDTWQKIVGFWSVMRWIRENVFLLLFMVGILAYTFGMVDLTSIALGGK